MRTIYLLGLLLLSNIATQAQTGATGMAATVIRIWKDSLVLHPGTPVKWTYDQGVVLEGFTALWKRTGDPKYFRYIQRSIDFFVDQQGNIRTYRLEDYNIDNVKNGRVLLTLFKATGDARYKLAADQLLKQLA